MTEHELPNTGDQGRSPLAVALADLADTMPEDPYRIDGVNAKTLRLRTRRRVQRATAGVVVGAATIAGLVVLRPAETNVAVIPATEPAATATLPTCASVLAAEAQAADAKAATAPVPATDEDAAKAAAAQAAAAGAPADGATEGQRGVKGYGTVVAATEAAVTFTAEPAFVPAGQPGEITAAVIADTVFLDGGTKLTTMPALNAGDRVAIAAAEVDGGYQLLQLEVHPVEAPAAAGAPAITPDDKAKAAAEPAVTSDLSKAVAEVVAVDGGTITLRVTDGSPLDATVTTGPDTAYMVGDQKCTDPQLAPGDNVGVVLTATGADAYTVDMVALPGEPKTG